MNEFIIEYELEKVKNRNTREYLKEVISSYNNENFRAAVVGLYTVVIFDILHKVVYLQEIYKSEEAIEILNDIDKIRKGDERSPKWEDRLIERITEECSDNKHDPNKKYLKFFDSYSYGKFKRLKNDRNKCAHPAHDSERLLRSYNRDEVRAHIRNMFENVFLKDSILATNICEMIDEDIKRYRDAYSYFINESLENRNIEEYFYSKYISKLFDSEKKLLFKYLWSKIIQIGAYKERQLTFKVLSMLINKNEILCRKYFQEHVFFQDSRYINEKMDEKYLDDNPIYLYNSFACIICLFAEHPDLFRILPRSIQLEIRNKCYKKLDYYLLAYYTDENLEEHFRIVEEFRKKEIKRITKNNYTPINEIPEYNINVLLKLVDLSKKMSFFEVYKYFILEYVIYGKNFDRCSDILQRLIPNIISDFTKEDCLKLLNVLNTHYDYYKMGEYSNGRHPNIQYYLKNLKESLDKCLGTNFEYAQFENLKL